MRLSQLSPERLVLSHVPLRRLVPVLLVEAASILPAVALFLRDSVSAAMSLFVLSLVLGPLVFLLFLRAVAVEFDRPAGTLTIRRFSLRDRSTTKHALADIRTVDLDAPPVTADRGGHRVVAQFRNGTRLPLHDDPVGTPAARHAAESITHWLRGAAGAP